MNVILPDEITIEKLNETHNLSQFKSYEKELVNFLKEDALNNQKQRLSITFLWFYQKALVGYITLLTDRINLEGSLKNYFEEKGIYYKSLPALKIGRLCVHDDYIKRSLGRWMVYFASQKADEINDNKAGCRFLTVDSKKEAIFFYKKLNFRILENTEKTTLPMFLDLKTDNFINKGGLNIIWQNQ